MLKIANPNLISASAATAITDVQKKPVIFWDTCSLLDIIRIPMPDKNNTPDVIEKVIELKNKIVAGDIVSLSSELCIDKFNHHIERGVKDLESANKKISRSYNAFIDFINALNLGTPAIAHTDLSVYKIEDLLVQIVHAITKKTLFVKEEDRFASFAHFRTRNKIPPAKKKGEYKDCYIWGTCLEVRRASKDKSYSYDFMSSNTKDYADGAKANFAGEEIANEASLNGISYLPNFKMAYGAFKNRGVL